MPYIAVPYDVNAVLHFVITGGGTQYRMFAENLKGFSNLLNLLCRKRDAAETDWYLFKSVVIQYVKEVHPYAPKDFLLEIDLTDGIKVYSYNTDTNYRDYIKNTGDAQKYIDDIVAKVREAQGEDAKVSNIYILIKGKFKNCRYRVADGYVVVA